MKFSLLAFLLALSTGLFAQDSIPSFSRLSKDVFKWLRNKDYGSLEKNMISVKEMMQLINPVLKDLAKEKDSADLIDTSKIATEFFLHSAGSIDAIYARGKQLQINWDRVSLISMSDSTTDAYMLSEYGIAQAQCTIKFSEGENTYGIEYGLRYLNKQWKIEELHPYIVVCKKDGGVKGVMRQDGYDTNMDGYNHPPQKYIKKNR
jgi:hypothetical protein